MLLRLGHWRECPNLCYPWLLARRLVASNLAHLGVWNHLSNSSLAWAYLQAQRGTGVDPVCPRVSNFHIRSHFVFTNPPGSGTTLEGHRRFPSVDVEAVLSEVKTLNPLLSRSRSRPSRSMHGAGLRSLQLKVISVSLLELIFSQYSM
jgi:hypothetical protein